MFACEGPSAAEAIKELKKIVSNRKSHHDGFFDRKEEVLRLLNYLGNPPEGVLAIVGPKSCGKSALLEEVQRLWATQSVLAVSCPIIYIDCRLTNFAVLEDAAIAMKEALSGFLDKVEQVSKSVTVTVPGSLIGIPGAASFIRCGEAVQAFRGQLSGSSTVMEMTSMFRRYLARNPRARPTLILDEAQFMKEWPEAELNRFIGVFTALTKQNHQAHFICCSSYDFFTNWLGKSFESGAWKAYGVGPFPEDQARLFFEYMLSDVKDKTSCKFRGEVWNELVEASKPEIPVPSVPDDNWKKVFDLCGGSPLHLRGLAVDIKEEGGIDNELAIESCLDMVLEKAMHICSRGLHPNPTAAWTGSMYMRIMDLIRDEGYTGFDKVVSTVSVGDVVQARKAIHAMVAENVLHVRYVSTNLNYMDMPSLSKPRHCYQVMAVSPPHLAAIRATIQDPDAAKFYMN